MPTGEFSKTQSDPGQSIHCLRGCMRAFCSGTHLSVWRALRLGRRIPTDQRRDREGLHAHLRHGPGNLRRGGTAPHLAGPLLHHPRRKAARARTKSRCNPKRCWKKPRRAASGATSPAWRTRCSPTTMCAGSSSTTTGPICRSRKASPPARRSACWRRGPSTASTTLSSPCAARWNWPTWAKSPRPPAAAGWTRAAPSAIIRC